MYQLREQLRYTLGNLDCGNFNDTGLKEIGDEISDPIYKRIKDTDGNVAELSVRADGLSSRVSSAEGNVSTLQQTANSLMSRISNAEGNVSTLQQTANSLTSRISNAEGNVSTLQQTASSLSSRMYNAEGNISSLSQTVYGFKISASNGDTSSMISLMVGSTVISSAQIALYGMVTFGALSGYGTSVINGANITTGTISASRIGANNGMYIQFPNDLMLGSTGTIWNVRLLRFPAASLECYDNTISISAYGGVYINGRQVLTA